MRPSRKPLLLLSFVGIVVATASARAQAPSEYPAACDAAKISRAESDRAHTVFLSGKGFLDESNYDKAISYFKDAYTIDCSVHGILPIIATAYERKGDKAEAVNALEEYLRRQPSAPDRDVVEHRIKNLKEQLQAAAPSATTPASATATTSAAPGSAPPTGPSTEPTTTAGTPESPPTSSGHTPTPWIVTGAGGAVLVAGVIIFIVGAGDVSNAEKTCPQPANCTSPPTISQGNNGRTLEGVGEGVGIAGLAAVAGGLVWHFLEKPPSSQSAAPAATAPSGPAVRLAPVVLPTYAGVGLGGSF